MKRQRLLSSVRAILAFAGLCVVTISCSGGAARNLDRLYGIVNSPAADGKLVSIDVRGPNDVTVTPVGTIGTFGCTSVALSSEGRLYSICGPVDVDDPHKYACMTPGPQRLTTIDAKTGRATLFGEPVEKLNVMGLEFAPDGTLYAVGDANPASPTFNTLYTVDQKTGAFSPVGSTGVPGPEFFMDLAFGADGTMYGASMHSLFTIDRRTGTATKVVDFVGGAGVMGLSFDKNHNRLYASDWKAPNSTLYLVDLHTGFLTPVAPFGYPLAHGLVPAI